MFDMRSRHAQPKGGKRKDLGDKYFRSKWEANYARYLNFLILKKELRRYEYEPETFYFNNIQRGCRFYTPDFKVWNNDGTIEYHEVKGWMDPKSSTKLKRMNKYYPGIKISIVGKDEYNAIREWRRLITGWED